MCHKVDKQKPLSHQNLIISLQKQYIQKRQVFVTLVTYVITYVPLFSQGISYIAYKRFHPVDSELRASTISFKFKEQQAFIYAPNLWFDITWKAELKKDTNIPKPPSTSSWISCLNSELN